MAAPGLPMTDTTRTARQAPGVLRSSLLDACCLGAAAGGFALSLGLGTCEADLAGTAAITGPSILAPIMQTHTQRAAAAECPRTRRIAGKL
jgi:hypothetical protein